MSGWVAESQQGRKDPFGIMVRIRVAQVRPISHQLAKAKAKPALKDVITLEAR
jgi:hypothetical protein